MLRVKKKTANWNKQRVLAICVNIVQPQNSMDVQMCPNFWSYQTYQNTIKYGVLACTFSKSLKAPEMVPRQWGSANVQSLASKLTSAPGRAADISGIYSNRSNITESMVIVTIMVRTGVFKYSTPGLLSRIWPVRIILKSYQIKTSLFLKLWRFTPTKKHHKRSQERFVWMLAPTAREPKSSEPNPRGTLPPSRPTLSPPKSSADFAPCATESMSWPAFGLSLGSGSSEPFCLVGKLRQNVNKK